MIKNHYCRLCSRVRENSFMECNAFSSLLVCAYGTYLFLENFHRVDLDVFLFGQARYLKDNKNYSLFQVFNFPQELFTVFSALLVRMYINCTVGSVSRLLW